MSEGECKQCGKEFSQLGQHWNKGSCNYPTFTNRQHEIITGTLMSDGNINHKKGRKPYFRLSCRTREWCEWFANEMGELAHSVKKYEKPDHFTDRDSMTMYEVATRGLPCLNEFSHWYDSGRKRYPDDLELTPLITKLWYAGDGTLYKPETARYTARIACNNEYDKPQFILNLFQDVGFDPYWNDGTIVFRSDDTEDLLEWIGEPIPGYEYKWDSNDNLERTFTPNEHKPWREYSVLKYEYVDQNKSINDLADEWDTSTATIFNWLNRHGIETQPAGVHCA